MPGRDVPWPWLSRSTSSCSPEPGTSPPPGQRAPSAPWRLLPRGPAWHQPHVPAPRRRLSSCSGPSRTCSCSCKLVVKGGGRSCSALTAFVSYFSVALRLPLPDTPLSCVSFSLTASPSLPGTEWPGVPAAGDTAPWASSSYFLSAEAKLLSCEAEKFKETTNKPLSNMPSAVSTTRSDS